MSFAAIPVLLSYPVNFPIELDEGKKWQARRARPFSRPDPYFFLSERIPKARLFEMIRSCVKRAVLALDHLDQYADELETLDEGI